MLHTRIRTLFPSLIERPLDRPLATPIFYQTQLHASSQFIGHPLPSKFPPGRVFALFQSPRRAVFPFRRRVRNCRETDGRTTSAARRMAAVSTRRMRGPRSMGRQPAETAKSTSSSAKPPSGPMARKTVWCGPKGPPSKGTVPFLLRHKSGQAPFALLGWASRRQAASAALVTKSGHACGSCICSRRLRPHCFEASMTDRRSRASDCSTGWATPRSVAAARCA